MEFVKKYKYVIALTVICIAAVFDVFGFFEASRTYDDLQKVLNQYQASIQDKEINDAQRSDLERAFNKKINGMYIFYTGIIKTVESDYRGGYIIEIATHTRIRNVTCEVDDELKDVVYGLQKGGNVSIRGQIDGVFLDYKIDDCEIITDKSEDNIHE